MYIYRYSISFILGYINRVIKTSEDGVPVYEIRHAGVDKTVICEDDFEGCKFKVNNVLLALRSITTQEKAYFAYCHYYTVLNFTFNFRFKKKYFLGGLITLPKINISLF